MSQSKANRLRARLQIAVIIAGLALFQIETEHAEAGFSVTSLDLRSSVRSSVIGESLTDAETIDQISNPLLNTTLGQIGDNIARTTFDFSWLEDVGIGDFNTTFSHAMRSSPSIRTVSSIKLIIETDAELRVSYSGLLDYSHTPGDETQFLFGTSILDVDTSSLFFSQGMEGGNADLLPASGQLELNAEVILPADRTYFFSLTLDADDLAEPNPGIYDANGFANISIRPVPEPQALLLVLFGASAAILRRPR